MLILSIDQGIANLGFSILKCKDNNIKKIIQSGTITTTTKEPDNKRILFLYEKLESICEKEKRNIKLLTCEKINGKIMRVQLITGILYLFSAKYNIPIIEIVPSSIKKEVCGNGRAKKEEIKKNINKIIEIKKKTTDHEIDSIAIGLTGYRKIRKKEGKYYENFKKQI